MTDGTNLYKVTPWYEGGELFDLAPMPEQSAKTVFAQLLDGLEFLHSSGRFFCSYCFVLFTGVSHPAGLVLLQCILLFCPLFFLKYACLLSMVALMTMTLRGSRMSQRSTYTQVGVGLPGLAVSLDGGGILEVAEHANQPSTLTSGSPCLYSFAV